MQLLNFGINWLYRRCAWPYLRSTFYDYDTFGKAVS